MRLFCPKDSEHKRFSVIAHVTQEWAVCEDGMYDETLDTCVDILAQPNSDDFVYTCLACGKEAITHGEIITVYATISSKDEAYLDIFNNEDEARNKIGTIQDGVEITDYIKGYCLRPEGHNYIYPESDDFYYTIDEAINDAENLGIDLRYHSAVK